MSRFGQIYKFLPRVPLLTSIVKKPVVFDIPVGSRGAKAAAKGGGKGGKKGAAMVKPVLEVETDAHKASSSPESGLEPLNVTKHKSVTTSFLSADYVIISVTYSIVVGCQTLYFVFDDNIRSLVII